MHHDAVWTLQRVVERHVRGMNCTEEWREVDDKCMYVCTIRDDTLYAWLRCLPKQVLVTLPAESISYLVNAVKKRKLTP